MLRALKPANKKNCFTAINLASIQTLIDVRNGVDAYRVAVPKGKGGEVYNIGGTTAMEVGGVLDSL